MPKSQASLDLKLYRALLLVGGIVIIGFGPINQMVEPGIVDPIWIRLGVGLSCLALVGLTFLSKWFRENALLGIYALFYVVSAWQVGLTYLNHLSVNTTFAMMLVIFGCAVGFRKPTHLAIYSGFVVLATGIAAFAVGDPQVSRITYLFTLSAIAILGYFVLRSRLKMVDELRDSMNASDVAAKAKSEFLATMSHEILTPLNGVIGMTTLLADSGLTDEQRDYVDTIRVSGESLLTIINDVLDFSKIEAEKIELEEQPFELRQCIEEALDLLASEAAEKHLELAYSLEDNVPETINGDVTRLRQILVNLLGNAVKFTENGEIVVSVESRGVRGADTQALHELQFSVRDTGIGIPEDRLSRLFTSFSQIDSSTTRKFGGTGLGLAISRRLAELMGGTMWVESEVGVGSTFFFTVLVYDAVLANTESLRGLQPQLQGKRVLIVDDNDTNRKILVRQSENWGMEPIAWSGAAEALEWVDRGGIYDFALLDMQMPEMDGLMLAEELRSRDTVRERPLIMLSSVGNRIRAGGLLDAALTKPVKQTQLFEVLTNVASTQERLRQLPESGNASPTPPASVYENDTPGASNTLNLGDSASDELDALHIADAHPEQVSPSHHEAHHQNASVPDPSSSAKENLPLISAGTKAQESTPPEVDVPAPQPSIDIPLPTPSATPFPEKKPLRILLAEDNAVSQKMALGILKRLGYVADVAANGLEVIKALELADYDVILMDVQMPEMDGLEATNHIRQTVPREKRPRIVAMTTNAMQDDRDRCLEAGMDDYVPKPVRQEDLAVALSKCARIMINRKPPKKIAAERATQTPRQRAHLTILDRKPTTLNLDSLIGPKAAIKPEPAPPRPANPERASSTHAEPTPSPPARAPGEPPTNHAPSPPTPQPGIPSPATLPGPPTMSADELDMAARAIPDHLRTLTGVEDLGFAEEVLASYLRADILLMEQILTAHSNGDAATVTKAVHKLKSSSGILGAKSLSYMCVKLERSARAGSVDGTTPLCDAIAADVQRFHVVAERALELIREQQRETASSST